MPEGFISLGKVIRPHGSKGLLRIWSYAQSESSFLDAGTVFLRSPSGNSDKFRVIFVRRHKNILLMGLEGLSFKEEAERYRESDILVRAESFSREPNECFWYELMGLQVYLDTGERLGSISQIIPTGSNDVYVVKEGNQEILVPATYEAVKGIDLENKKMFLWSRDVLIDCNEI
jgi:16S rRNA processing protein RimM